MALSRTTKNRWSFTLGELAKVIKLMCYGLLCLLVTAQTQADLSIVTESYKPYSYVNEQNMVDGAATAVVRQVVDKAGLTGTFEMVPWARAFRTASTTENVLIYSMTRNEEREANFHWIGIVCQTELTFVRKTGALIAPISMNEAKAFSIAVGSDQYGHKHLKGLGFKHLIITGGADINIKMLVNGRADLIYTDPAWVRTRAKELGFSANAIEKVDSIEADRFPLYLAASKNTPITTVKKLQNAYQTLEKEGVFEEIWRNIDQWIH